MQLIEQAQPIPTSGATSSLHKAENINGGLSQRQLAKRLRCDPRRLTERRDDPAILATYTTNKDPDGLSWEYRKGAKLYYPIGLESA